LTGYQDASFRLRVAKGFLEEARQDVTLGRWRSVVDNSQLAGGRASNRGHKKE